MKFGLKNKILISLSLILFLCGITISYFIYIQSRKNSTKYIQEKIETLVVERKNRVVDFFNDSKAIAQKISQRGDVMNYIKGENSFQDEHILSILQNYNIGERYSAIYLMNKSGVTMASTNKTFVGKNYGFREYFQKAIMGEPRVYVAIGATSNMPGYYVSYPIKSENEIVGVVVLKTIPQYLNKIFTKENLGESADTDFIFADENGIVIYSSDEKKNYHSLGNLTEKKRKEIADSKKFASLDILPLDYNEIQEEINEISNVPISYNLDDDNDGAQELVVAVKTENFPFVVISETNMDKILASSRRLSYFLVGMFLAIIAFGSLVSSIIIANFLAPFRELGNIAQEVSKGKYEKLRVIKTNDEVEQLSVNLKKMADRLIKLKKRAEEKVVESNTDLEKINSYMTGREIKMIELKKKIKELENKISKNDK